MSRGRRKVNLPKEQESLILHSGLQKVSFKDLQAPSAKMAGVSNSVYDCEINQMSYLK
jgi:hypothetical protein